MTKQTKIKIGFIAIIAIFLIALLTSCGNKPQGKVTEVNNKQTGESYTIKEIDGCEYIEVDYNRYTSSRVYSLTHKGNCKNPIHNVNR